MFTYLCPSCGAAAFSAADQSNVPVCPRCAAELVPHPDDAISPPAPPELAVPAHNGHTEYSADSR